LVGGGYDSLIGEKASDSTDNPLRPPNPNISDYQRGETAALESMGKLMSVMDKTIYGGEGTAVVAKT